MSAKYYTQFILTDARVPRWQRVLRCGRTELPDGAGDSDRRDIEAILASNFDLQQEAVKLVSWSRLH